MRQERRERSWAPGMSWPALSASLMAALSGLLVVVKLSHWGSRASSSSISTACVPRQPPWPIPDNQVGRRQPGGGDTKSEPPRYQKPDQH